MKQEILSRIQKKFPLVPKPFEAIANELNMDEDEVLEILQAEKKQILYGRLLPFLIQNVWDTNHL